MLSRRSGTNMEEEEICRLDEGWWASVLADDERWMEHSGDGYHRVEPQLVAGLINWQRIKSLHEQDEVVSLEVYGYNRGGLLLRGEDIQGFVPVSHLVDVPCNVDEEKRLVLLAAYVGRTLQLKVIECEPEQERVVLSERAALAGVGQRKKLLSTLKAGDVVEGSVSNVTEFGVFVDLGGVEGLVHVSELSWGRVHHPSEILCVGQVIKALVLQVCEDSARVALSYKRLFPNPWEDLARRYRVGDVVTGKVTGIMNFGVFVRLTEGVEGLIHISSLPENFSKEDKRLDQGREVKVRILHLDVHRRRLGLGLVEVE
ncbi:MAG: S1 RNA-binding domain-containing protein [Anaerolineae bacterium]|nr:S1 RNA-binding domain-containing protein [Anaerolineae bacterium]